MTLLRRAVEALERIATALERPPDIELPACPHAEWEIQGTMGNVTRRCKECDHEERVQ